MVVSRATRRSYQRNHAMMRLPRILRQKDRSIEDSYSSDESIILVRRCRVESKAHVPNFIRDKHQRVSHYHFDEPELRSRLQSFAHFPAELIVLIGPCTPENFISLETFLSFVPSFLPLQRPHHRRLTNKRPFSCLVMSSCCTLCDRALCAILFFSFSCHAHLRPPRAAGCQYSTRTEPRKNFCTA